MTSSFSVCCVTVKVVRFLLRLLRTDEGLIESIKQLAEVGSLQAEVGYDIWR
jgi:hypothetical protein